MRMGAMSTDPASSANRPANTRRTPPKACRVERRVMTRIAPSVLGRNSITRVAIMSVMASEVRATCQTGKSPPSGVKY